MAHSTRPFDSTGLDQAMSDQRVYSVSLSFDRENRSHHRRDIVNVTVWCRGCPNAAAPDYRALGITGCDLPLTVNMNDGRSMSMFAYLRDEASNAVRMTKAERQAARAERKAARAARAASVARNAYILRAAA